MKPKDPTTVSGSISYHILWDNTRHIFYSLLKCHNAFSPILFADDFASYFTKKIESIIKLFLSCPTTSTNPSACLPMYSALSPITTNCPHCYLSNPLFEHWSCPPLHSQDFFPTVIVPSRLHPTFLHYCLLLTSFICCLYTIHIYLYAIIHLRCLQHITLQPQTTVS